MNLDRLPDVKSPEALRYAADVISNLDCDTGDHFHLCNDLMDQAERLEREQAAEAVRNAIIERAAREIIWPQQGVHWKDADPRDQNDAKIIARCLFDAGLLNVDGASYEPNERHHP